MIGVTHTGKIGDFSFCLPICSWLYKTTNEKIIFIIPDGYPFFKKIESLLRLQSFTEDVIYCNFKIDNFDVGGQPYKFNPHDYINNLNISSYYNFGFRSSPDKFVSNFYAEEYNLGVDLDFVLNLDLDFKYKNNKLICSEVLTDSFPNYETIDFNYDFLYNLRELAYAKERHMHCSSLACYLGWARIPIYLYLITRIQPFVDLLTYNGINKYNINDYWYYYKHVSLLDARGFDENNKIISEYDKIYFK